MAAGMVVDTAVVVGRRAVLATVVGTVVAAPTDYTTVEVETAARAAGPIVAARLAEMAAMVVDTET